MISEAECGERSSNYRESRMDFDFRGKLKDRHGSAFSTDVSDEEGTYSWLQDIFDRLFFLRIIR